MRCNHPGCKSYALKGDPSGLCFWHSPATADRRRKAGKKGGSRGKLPVEVMDINSIKDVRDILAEAISELRASSTESIVAKARALGYLCNVAMVCIEKGELEDRVARLEELLNEKTA